MIDRLRYVREGGEVNGKAEGVVAEEASYLYYDGGGKTSVGVERGGQAISLAGGGRIPWGGRGSQSMELCTGAGYAFS